MDTCSNSGHVMVLCLVMGWLAWSSAGLIQAVVAGEDRTDLSRQILFNGCEESLLGGVIGASGDYCKNKGSNSNRSHSNSRSNSGSSNSNSNSRRNINRNSSSRNSNSSSAVLVPTVEGSTNQTSSSMLNLLLTCRRNFAAVQSILINRLLLLINSPRSTRNPAAVAPLNLLSLTSPSPPSTTNPHPHTSVPATVRPSELFSYGGLQAPAPSISRKLLTSPSSADQSSTARTDSLTLGPPDPPQPRAFPDIKKTSSTLHPPDPYFSSLPP